MSALAGKKRPFSWRAVSLWVWALAGSALAGALLWAPDNEVLGRISTTLGLAQLVALPALGAGAVLACVLFLILVLLVGKLMEVRWKRGWGLAVWLWLIMTALVGANLSPLGVNRPAVTGCIGADCVRTTVMEWNVASLTPSTLGQRVMNLRPDVIVLPEVSGGASVAGRESAAGGVEVEQVRADLEEVGLPVREYQIFLAAGSIKGGRIGPTAVLVKKSYGIYEQVDAPQVSWGTVHLRPQGIDAAGGAADGAAVNGAAGGAANGAAANGAAGGAVSEADLAGQALLPDIIGLHTMPPLPSTMKQWRSDLEQVKELMAAQRQNGRPTIFAGDFNATWRHAGLGRVPGYADALAGGQWWLSGTWPSALPPLLRSGIDHIFIPDSMQITRAQVLASGSPDHAPIIATLVAQGR